MGYLHIFITNSSVCRFYHPFYLGDIYIMSVCSSSLLCVLHLDWSKVSVAELICMKHTHC